MDRPGHGEWGRWAVGGMCWECEVGTAGKWCGCCLPHTTAAGLDPSCAGGPPPPPPPPPHRTPQVKGYRRVVFCQSVRDDVEDALGEGAWADLLPRMCQGRLVPTPWLNKVWCWRAGGRGGGRASRWRSLLLRMHRLHSICCRSFPSSLLITPPPSSLPRLPSGLSRASIPAGQGGAPGGRPQRGGEALPGAVQVWGGWERGGGGARGGGYLYRQRPCLPWTACCSSLPTACAFPLLQGQAGGPGLECACQRQHRPNPGRQHAAGWGLPHAVMPPPALTLVHHWLCLIDYCDCCTCARAPSRQNYE